MFSDLFGMHPWDVDRLTITQFNAHAEYAHHKTREG